MTRGYAFTSDVWRWTARREIWLFATVPPDQSDEIAAIPRVPRGFGSVRVRATVGATSWETSIFPGSDGYVLPLKRAVLQRERLEEGDVIEASVELI